MRPCPLQALLDWYEEQVGDLSSHSLPAPLKVFSSLPPCSSPPTGTARDTRLRALRDETDGGDGGGGGGGSLAAAAQEVAAREAALQLQRKNAGRPLVLIVEAAESADPDSLQDLILILSEVSTLHFLLPTPPSPFHFFIRSLLPSPPPNRPLPSLPPPSVTLSFLLHTHHTNTRLGQTPPPS